MSWDIYGNPLRRGYCEVHPDVHQEYPCSICMAQKQQQSQPHNELEQLQYEFAQQGDYIRHLESERAALSTQVESLLDDRKEFVKKEFQLLKEIERLEIELKKRDEQNAALAAQVEALRNIKRYSMTTEYNKFACEDQVVVSEFDDGDYVKYADIEKHIEKTPQQHLAETKAQAVEQFALHVSDNMNDGIDRAKLIILASEHISSIRQEGK